MSKKYEKAILRWKTLSEIAVPTGEEDDEIDGLETYLEEKNSFKNPLDRKIAQKIIERSQGLFLDTYGGYPLYGEVSFEVGGEKYAVIAYGVSNIEGGKDALCGMIFVKEDKGGKR